MSLKDVYDVTNPPHLCIPEVIAFSFNGSLSVSTHELLFPLAIQFRERSEAHPVLQNK